MAFPPDIATRVVTLGGAMSIESSALLKVRVTVSSSKSLVWDATGYRFERVPDMRTSELGSEVSFILPRTDVSGWKDAETNQLIDVSAPNSYTHRYTAAVEILDDKDRVMRKVTMGPFVIPDGDGPIDLDKTVPASTVAGDVIAVPDLWGQLVTEAQTAAEEAAQAATDATGAVAPVAADVDGLKTLTTTGRLSETGLDTQIVQSSPQAVARRLLSSQGIPEGATVATPPTVTLGTAGAAPTIAGGVRVAPKRLSATIIDVAGDPHFEYVGIIPGRLEVSSSDMTYANYLTGGSSQNARNRGRYRFAWTGQAFEAYFRARGATIDIRIYVDGVPVSVDGQSIAVTASSRYYLKVEFATLASRVITLEVTDPEFGGIVIEPTASVRRPERKLLMAAMGDSHTAGANGISWRDTWPRRVADALGIQFANVAIGGTGYLNTATGNFRLRLAPDLFPLAPDVVVLEGSWNDSTATEPQLQAEAAYVFDTIRAALPHALLIAAGPWVTSHTLSATLDAHDATLRAQAQASGWNGYISYRDPMGLKATSPAWAASTVYAVGDVVVQNGFAQVCVTAHTSAASFDQTKWRSTAMVGGTGRVGATAGNGNADVLVSSDTVHGTALAHSVKAAFVAAAILRIARAVAQGATWAA